MPKLSLLAGTTSKTIKVFIQDNSVTTGAGLTGLVFNTASLTAYYTREGTNGTTVITLVTATQGTWTSSGFIVVDATNMPGLYEIGVPNAAIAAGAKSVVIYLKGATNMAPVVVEIELTVVDNQSTGYGLVNASANAVQLAGQTITAAAGVTFPTSVASPTNITAGTITTVTNLTNAPTSGDLTATMKTSVTTAATAATPTAAAVTGAVGSVTAAVIMDQTQNLGASPWNTTTIQQALQSAWAGFGRGKSVITGTTQNVYAPDGTTVLKAFTLDSATSPTSRT